LPRLAWFTVPPPNDAAAYDAGLLPHLLPSFDVDVFLERAAVRGDGDAPFGAHDFVWKHAQRPYDLVVYQLDGTPAHDYLWAYLARYPGLVVLHDGLLHRGRARRLVADRRLEDYRREFRYSHPDVSMAIAELEIAGLLGPMIDRWPMRRVVTASARMVAVHGEALAGEIREEDPACPVAVVDPGVRSASPAPGARDAIRGRHGIDGDAVLFLAFETTSAARWPQAVRAFEALGDLPVRTHLLGIGAAGASAGGGAAGRITVCAPVTDEEWPDYLAAADACLCLAWPPRPAPLNWLRCLAAGLPTVIVDAAGLADVPSCDPRGWAVLHAPPAAASRSDWPRPPAPACLSIDILDEQHSLALALGRLATDPAFRSRIGNSARALWEARFTAERLAASWRTLVADACAAPPRADALSGLPAHFRSNGLEHAATLLRRDGFPDTALASVWAREPTL
jgi:hypothetical protein